MEPIDFNYSRFYKYWINWMSILNVAGLIHSLLVGTHLLWMFAVLLSFVVYIFLMPQFLQKTLASMGYANWITTLRLFIILLLFGLFPRLSTEILFAGFLFAICLDGVDGYLARKFNQSSQIGGNLDMETDAFLVLSISWIHVEQGRFHWWLLIPGGLRYIYQLAFFWSKSEGEILPKRARATIAVIFFISLTSAFIIPDSIAYYLVILSSVLICISFACTMYIDFKSI